MGKFTLEKMELIDTITDRIDPTKHKIIAIVGLPATGKSELSKLIWDKKDGLYNVHHGDDYLKVRGTVHPAALFEAAVMYDENEWKIFEGCQVYTVLLLGQIKPDLIIECVADKETRFKRRLKDTPTFDKRLKQAWARYISDNPGVEIWQHDTSQTNHE